MSFVSRSVHAPLKWMLIKTDRGSTTYFRERLSWRYCLPTVAASTCRTPASICRTPASICRTPASSCLTLIEKVTPQSTKSATKFWVRVVCDFAREKGISFDFATIEDGQLARLLEDFYCSLRKKDGTEYKRSSSPVALYSVS